MSSTRPIVLVVRHPDASNDYTVDGDVATIDIDLGSSFDRRPEDEGQALEFAENIEHWLDKVPTTSPIFTEVVDTIRDVVGRFEAAVKLVDEYVERRHAADQATPEPTVQPSRGREATRALTEVRTVLSRAVTARKVLDEPTEYHRSDGPGGIDFARGRYEDQDAAEMRAALDEVIERLSRWRRTGKAKTSTPGS